MKTHVQWPRLRSCSAWLNTPGFPSARMLWLTQCALLACLFSPSQAQVPTNISGSGLGTKVNGFPTADCAGSCDITGGTRPGGMAGTNLFHSFGDFSVGPGDVAQFLNQGSVDLAGNLLGAGLPTSNIVGRVTGGNVSQIYGTIRTTNFGAANLFLLNPTGFIFGEKAVLNVGGSFTAATADYIRFPGPGGDIFYANEASPPPLTVASPVAFGFLDPPTHGITVQGGTLSVPNGQSLNLVGGDITVQAAGGPGTTPAALSAPGGEIRLASAASAGEFIFSSLSEGPNVNNTEFALKGTTTLEQGTVVSTSGDPSGAVYVRGGQFYVDDAEVRSDGLIEVTVDQITLKDRGVIETQASDTGPAGNIVLDVDGLSIESGAGIRTSGNDVFSSGNILVTATESTSVTGQFDSNTRSRIVNENGGSGGTGNIALQTGTLTLADGGRIISDTFFDPNPPAPGDPIVPKLSITADGAVWIKDGSDMRVISFLSDVGSLTLDAGSLTMENRGVITTFTVANGRGGDLSVGAGDIFLSGGSQLSSESQLGAGRAGDISVVADNQLSISGVGLDENGLPAPSGIFSNTSTPFPAPFFTGDAGNISVTAESIAITDGGKVESSSSLLAFGNAGQVLITAPTIFLNGGSISTSTEFSGNAGSVELNAGTVTLENGSQVTSSSSVGLFGEVPSGDAGKVTVQGVASPANSILIDGGTSGIFTTTQGTGAGGDIFVKANSVTLQNGGTISAETSGTEMTATGGNINVQAGQDINLVNNATVSAKSTGPANAGEIKLVSGGSIHLNGSEITAEARQASGGNIKLTAPNTVLLKNSTISTSVQGGPMTVGGNINIDPQFVILQNSKIIAHAIQGQGGNITIVAGTFLQDASSIIDASSQFGLSGSVTIQSPLSNLSQVLAPMPQAPLAVGALLRSTCAARVAEGEMSSFVERGRDGLPTEPGGWLGGPFHAAAALPVTSGIHKRSAVDGFSVRASGDDGVVSIRGQEAYGLLRRLLARNANAGCSL